VAEVVLVGVHKKLVDAAREHLPEWSDCSNLLGSASSCFDDPRVAIIYEDAYAWFTSQYSGRDNDEDEGDFDVIIVDTVYADHVRAALNFTFATI